MNKIKNIALLAGWLLLGLSCGNQELDLSTIQPTPGTGSATSTGDTITYRAQVWVDRADLEYYGGERTFNIKLKEMFRKTTRFWNESPNKFKYYFEFVPGEELHIYDTGNDPSRYEEFRSQAYGLLNTEKYDFVVFFALNAEETGLSCGGGGASGQSVVNAFLPRSVDIFADAEYPNQGTYSNLGHEYGHMRGAQDLYQYLISAESNRVSGEAYNPPACNMGTGYMVWSDYCSALFNYTAHQKQLDRELNKKIYPDKLIINVTKDNEPKRGVVINFFGTRAGGYFGGPDVYDAEGNSPYLVEKSNSQGQIVINNTYNMFFPGEGAPNTPPKSPKDEWPFSRWYCFLMEIVDGENKRYMWLSDLDMCTHLLETGERKYTISIDL